MPGAIALTITDRPSSTLVFLVIEDEAAAGSAYEAFTQAVRRLGSPSYELICLTEAEAAKVEVSEEARVYRLS